MIHDWNGTDFLVKQTKAFYFSATKPEGAFDIDMAKGD